MLYEGKRRRIFGPKREEVKIVRVIKSMKMRWAGHVARVRDEKCIQNFCWKT
jgi:hypothetical protein